MTRETAEEEVEALAESVGVDREVIVSKIRADGSKPDDHDG